MSEPRHKIIITGTGRTGTTFLVQLLTELGLDTGYTAENWSRDYFEHCSAGLERDLMAEDAPYVVKNPNLCQTLPALLATGRFAIDQVLVPIRDLDDATRSRVRVGGRDGLVPGGLVGTADPAAQKGILAEGFHQLMHAIAVHDLPHILLHFPRVAVDADYAWEKLSPVTPGVAEARFRAAFARVSRPALIHQFEGGAAGQEGAGAERFLRAERRKRRRRRAKRLGAAAALLVAFLLLTGLYVRRSGAARPPAPDAAAGAGGR